MLAIAATAGNLNIGTVVVVVVSVLVAIFTSVTAPLVIAHRTEKMHRDDVLADYRRQDEVARRVAVAAAESAGVAQQLLDAQKDSARRTEELARMGAENRAKLNSIHDQAKQIHILVNSDMTAARQSELAQTRALLSALERVVALARDRGLDPDQADVDAITRAKDRITELDHIIADRIARARQIEELLCGGSCLIAGCPSW